MSECESSYQKVRLGDSLKNINGLSLQRNKAYLIILHNKICRNQRFRSKNPLSGYLNVYVHGWCISLPVVDVILLDTV